MLVTLRCYLLWLVFRTYSALLMTFWFQGILLINLEAKARASAQHPLFNSMMPSNEVFNFILSLGECLICSVMMREVCCVVYCARFCFKAHPEFESNYIHLWAITLPAWRSSWQPDAPLLPRPRSCNILPRFITTNLLQSNYFPRDKHR